MPLSPAPALPSPAQLYRPTGLFAVARMYWRSTHSSVTVVSFKLSPQTFYTIVRAWAGRRTWARVLQRDAPVRHDHKILRVGRVGAVLDVERAHVLPVGCLSWNQHHIPQCYLNCLCLLTLGPRIKTQRRPCKLDVARGVAVLDVPLLVCLVVGRLPGKRGNDRQYSAPILVGTRRRLTPQRCCPPWPPSAR
jgi:hypothetical protein